jgi:hypothetical protein
MQVIGVFHQLPEEMTNALIMTEQWHVNATQKDANRRLHNQEEKSEQNKKLTKEKKLKASMQDFMNALYLHQQYSSPCCSMTAMQMF